MKKIAAIPLVAIFILGIAIYFYSQQTGSVKLETAGITVKLRGLHGVFWKSLQVGPSIEPVNTHVGQYLAVTGNLIADADGDRWQLSFYPDQSQSSRITVAKNQTTTLEFGPPLNIKTEVESASRRISVGLSIAGDPPNS